MAKPVHLPVHSQGKMPMLIFHKVGHANTVNGNGAATLCQLQYLSMSIEGFGEGGGQICYFTSGPYESNPALIKASVIFPDNGGVTVAMLKNS